VTLLLKVELFISRRHIYFLYRFTAIYELCLWSSWKDLIWRIPV